MQIIIRLSKEIIAMLPTAEIQSAVDALVSNYDLTGYYYKKYNEEEFFFKKYFGECTTLIQYINQEAINTVKKDKDYSWMDKKTIDSRTRYQVWDFYRAILEYLEEKARIVSENRAHLRIKVGSTINYDECIYHYPFYSNVEFYKDGGWGIGTENGLVIVKNNLVVQPSKIYLDGSSPLRIIQDRDTKKYGVLSFATFHEVIHCHYDEIIAESYYEDQVLHHFIKVRKDNKWGCFDENFALLINCLYHDIQYVNGFFEGVRDGDYLTYDKFPDGFNGKCYDSVYVGKKDLYDSNGLLQIGGYDELEFENDYLLFYWGTSYKQYYVKESDFEGGYIKLSKLKLSYENAQCLVVNENFVSIIRDKGEFFRIPKGKVLENKETFKRVILSSILLPYHVNLFSISDGFIFLENENGGSFVYSIWSNKSSPFDKNFSGWQDKLIEDDNVIIIHYTKDMIEDWRTSVNEVSTTEFERLYYRIGTKYGFVFSNGIEREMFDAIIENTKGELIIAKTVKNDVDNDCDSSKEDYKILYYRKLADGTLEKIEGIKEVYKLGKLVCSIPVSFPYTDYYSIDNERYFYNLFPNDMI